MMWKKRILAMAAATLALGATAGGIAQAGDEWVHERRAEANLDVPRNADGSIDGQTFRYEVDSLVARGVRMIQIRDASFTHEEARSLLIPLEGNLIGEFANRLPNDGIQRQITLHGDVDVRVQRMANGELRASIKDLVVVNPTEARRAEYALLLAEKYGLDRLTVRAIDAEGNRLRVEYRADQGIVRNESRPGHRLVEGGESHADRGKDKHGDEHHADRDDREDHADRHKHRGEHHAKWGGHHGRSEHHAHHGRDRGWDRAERRDNGKDRVERHAKFERKERAERPERREDRMERPERHVKFERPERHERAARPERVERPERSGRH